ncbi:TetR/AcrR family transcriptional regulator [Phytoactinopolyspora halotolerans]|uniref:TetR family transcriptional regulator n=1 Tax=Phytoactinopolyspora halotolerans TaxID=1981512 RepID=A0A6L9S973_9ACTN|nr:TetR family transcriptional regulator C-terminal domain-containing protein [Phytoactinopolyspora halotolerans]NEE01619.1 TetR family transcriptional regulator [Phytoactinopolyspora halotolerans]
MAEVRRRQPPEVRRQMIVDAAVPLLHESGLRGITLRGIARAAGVSVGTVTYHFRSVADIVDVAVAQDVTAYYERLEERVRAESDPLGALDLLIEGVFTEETRRHWQLWFDSIGPAEEAREVRSGQRSRYARWNEMLRAMVTDGAAAGAFVAPDPDRTVTLLVALVDGLSLQRLRGEPALTTQQAREHFRAAAFELLGVPHPR